MAFSVNRCARVDRCRSSRQSLALRASHPRPFARARDASKSSPSPRPFAPRARRTSNIARVTNRRRPPPRVVARVAHRASSLSVRVDAFPYATRALVAPAGAGALKVAIADGRRPARGVARARAGVAARRVTCARIAMRASRCAARVGSRCGWRATRLGKQSAVARVSRVRALDLSGRVTRGFAR